MHRLSLALLLTGCITATQTPPPAILVEAEPVPARPEDPSRPLDAVMWTMGYDLRAFDDVWTWLHAIPESDERTRAIGTAALLGVCELDRLELADEGLAALEAGIAAFPEDDRLPMWHAFIRFAVARTERDETAIEASLIDLRSSATRYPAFNLVGLTLSISGYEDASPPLIDEGLAAFEAVTDETAALQLATDPVSIERTRRVFDSPIAPYGIPALMAMMGDMALRAGDLPTAQRHYYTALRSNGAHRWPWRAEVERRLNEAEAVAAGMAARPATEHALGSHAAGAMGVPEARIDPRFEGRIGNGSCTVCHTHRSTSDLGAPLPEIGWIRGRFLPIEGVTSPLPTVFALSDTTGEIPPGGFGIGPAIPADAPRDFFTRDDHDRTFLIPVEPGRYFVAMSLEANGTTYQGYAARELLQPWFVDVTAGLVTDTTAFPIVLGPLP
jgi:hypothetical protein